MNRPKTVLAALVVVLHTSGAWAQTVQTISGLPVQVRPYVPEVGSPSVEQMVGAVNTFGAADAASAADTSSTGASASTSGTGDGSAPASATNGGSGTAGSNVASSVPLTKMINQPWGGQAADNAQSVGLNPSALAATCVAESGCNGNQATVAGQSAQGTFQMQPAAFQEGLATALAANPALASQVISGDAGRYDPVTAAIAASGYLLQAADTLQAQGIGDPTVLQTRAYYVFGPGAGPSVAAAADDKPLSEFVSSATLAQNKWPATETVGQWRTSVSAVVGNAANQSVLSR